MSDTVNKGNLGELEVAADLIRQGFHVAFPFGHNSAYDLIVERLDGTLERVQVKYVESDGETIQIKCASQLHNFQSQDGKRKYTPYLGRVEWIAVYDKTTNKCYYVPNKELNKNSIWLRLVPPKNNQTVGIRWAKDYCRLSVEV